MIKLKLKCKSWPVPFKAEKSFGTSYFLSMHLDTLSKIAGFDKCSNSQTLKVNSFHLVELKLQKH